MEWSSHETSCMHVDWLDRNIGLSMKIFMPWSWKAQRALSYIGSNDGSTKEKAFIGLVKVGSCQTLADHAEPAAHLLRDAHTLLACTQCFSQLHCRTSKGLRWVVIWDKALLPPGLKIPLGFGSQCTLVLSQVMCCFQQWKIKDGWRQILTPISLALLSCLLIWSHETLSFQRAKSEKYLALHLWLA